MKTLRVRTQFFVSAILLTSLVFSGCASRLTSAQGLLDNMGGALQDIDTVHFISSLKLDGVYGDFQNLHLTIDGQFDARNFDNHQGAAHIIADGTYNQEAFSVDLNIVATGQRLYIQINSINSESLAAAVDTKKLLNQFVQINDWRVFTGNLDAVPAKNAGGFSEDALRALQQTLGDARFFTATKDNGEARINEVNTRLLSVAVSGDNVKKFLDSHPTVLPVQTLLPLIENMTGDVWVSPLDDLPYKYHFVTPVQSNDGSTAIITLDGTAEYNVPVNIYVPKSVMLLPVFIQRVLPPKTFQFLFGK